MFGDVHKNVTTQTYWVFSEKWEAQLTNIAFIHLYSKKENRYEYTWDTAKFKWNKHEQNKNQLPGPVEVVFSCFCISKLISILSQGHTEKPWLEI